MEEEVRVLNASPGLQKDQLVKVCVVGDSDTG